MKFRRHGIVSAIFLVVMASVLIVGCSRTLGPVAPPVTPKVTATFSPTNTYSPTNTFTGVVNTNTFTPSRTHTPTFTNSFTSTPTTPGAFTFTWTPTATSTDTFTNTPTMTPTPTQPPDPNTIDDLEDGDGQVSPNGNRDGYWYTYSDGTGTMVPDPAGAFSVVIGGNPGNMAQITGSGFTNWGAGMGFNFVQTEPGTGNKLPYDISGYTGIVFDVRVGPGSQTGYRVEIAAPSTSGDTAHYGADLTATTSWQSVTVYFNLMTQPSWGSPAVWDPTQTYGIQWKVGAGASFDLQVDNIKFITTPGPTPTPTIPPDPLLLDNCEDNNGQINVIAGRNGDWFTMTDANSGGDSTVNPPAGTEFTMTAGGSLTTGYRARITGTLGAAYAYRFVGVGMNMIRTANPTDPKIAYDATAYTGFTFQIRNDGAATIIRVSVTNSDTDPDGGICAPASMCSNNYGKDLSIPTGSWQSVTVFFNLMTQESGWGYTPPLGFSAAQIYGIQWQVKGAAGLGVDLSIDDVRFVNIAGPTPTPSPTPNPFLIDDMEDNDNRINVVSGRGGYWYTFSDQSENWPVTEAHSTIWPPDVPKPAPALVMSSPGNPNAGYALRITGTMRPSCAPSYTYCGYAAVGFDFVDKPETQTQKILYNLSAFTGVRFYAKGTGTSIRLNMPDYFTSPVSEGGDCPSACSNNFGWILGQNYFGPTTMINPAKTANWQFYQIPFWVMCQEQYWGHNVTSADVPTCNDAPTTPNSGCLDLTKVFGMQFKLNNDAAGSNFDFWVDDMILY